MTWPSAVFDAPLLRGLDAPSRAAVVAAGRLVERPAAAAIYREGDDSDAFFVVIDGAVELRAVRRGDEAATLLRVARRGDSFGEEAMLPGVPRRVSAAAAEAVRLAEIPIAVFRRVTGRADDAAAAGREWRYLQRAAARDLLAQSAFARDLGADDVDLLLDAMRLEHHERGARLYEVGDRAEHLWFVVEGLVQLQRDDQDRTSVLAYLARGDFFGDQETLSGTPRGAAAVAAGDTWCAAVPRDALRTLADRNPGLLPRLRRVADTRSAAQLEVVGAAAARSTQHAFKDLYRLQMARSLLVIDQDSCVRCGHCAWSCGETHDGISRLIRRGDKVVTATGAGTAALLLPNTCQHCRHAACMIDCPTGAIGRDPEGEVFIRADLCTGCGNCARSCPWDNIQLALRPVPIATRSKEVAVKCDLCRGNAAPACVEACPTGSLIRIDPGRDVAEVAQVLGLAAATGAMPLPRARPWGGVALAIAIVLAAAAWAHHAAWSPRRGVGFLLGVLAGVMILGLGAYVIPKRLVRWRVRPRARGPLADEQRPPPRSRTRRALILHIVLGLGVPAAALGHAGVRLSATSGGALLLALAVATLLGGLGALVYRAIPRALTRLERRGALPEDLAAEREELAARLYQETSGKDEKVKLLVARVLLPYARARLGALALIASRRDLAAEERRLGAHIDEVLAGRGQEVRAEVAPLCRIAVELRALPARRALTAALRGWLPLHVVTSAMVVALLIVHVVTAVRW